MHPWKRALIIPVTLLAIAFGFLIALQMQAQKNISLAEQITVERMIQTKAVLANAQVQNETLKIDQNIPYYHIQGY